MAGIYQRDNYAQLMQNALNNAYNRSAATQRERAERVKEIVNAGGDFAKVVGRTAEEWNVPEKYEDNPDYRAARFDYILSGDRSGLDAFRQAEMQAEQARKQQEFTAAENALNRKMQMAENKKNREIQRQQHGLEKAAEKARMVRNYKDATDTVSYYEKEGANVDPLVKAKARNDAALQLQLLKNSGQFTAEELSNIEASGGKTLDDLLAELRRNKGAGAPEQEAPETPAETPAETQTESWNKFNRRFGEIATADQKQLDALSAEFAKYKGPQETNSDEYGKWEQGIAKRQTELKNQAAAKQMKEARLNHFKDNVIPNITTVHVKKLLNGKTEATENRTWNYGGKERPATLKYKLNANGSEAEVYVDGEYAGKVPVKYSN
jgi:hypothetical protein